MPHLNRSPITVAFHCLATCARGQPTGRPVETLKFPHTSGMEMRKLGALGRAVQPKGRFLSELTFKTLALHFPFSIQQQQLQHVKHQELWQARENCCKSESDTQLQLPRHPPTTSIPFRLRSDQKLESLSVAVILLSLVLFFIYLIF